MKKFASKLAIVMALVLCLGVMSGCTAKADEETKKPTTSTNGDKNESKPSQTKPEENKGESKPEEDKNDATTESKPQADKEEGTTEPKPEGSTASQG